jgi:GNAT superfamily N-acetyltransferase
MSARLPAESSLKVEVRPIAPSDLDAVVVGWHQTNRDSYTYVALHQQHTLADARDFFVNNVMRECDVRVAVARVNGAQTACGVIALKADWIMQLAVFAGWRRHGVGSVLVSHAMSLRPSGLQLYTFQRNTPARDFYERRGFVAAAFGVSPAPESEPDVLYRWPSPRG